MAESCRDSRPLVRINVSVMVEKNGRKETGVYGVGGRQSYDEFLKMITGKNLCKPIELYNKFRKYGLTSRWNEGSLGPGWPAILIH